MTEVKKALTNGFVRWPQLATVLTTLAALIVAATFAMVSIHAQSIHKHGVGRAEFEQVIARTERIEAKLDRLIEHELKQ